MYGSEQKNTMASVQQHILERHIVQAVETIESEVDAQLHALDTLDEDDLEKIRRKRLDDMKKYVLLCRCEV